MLRLVLLMHLKNAVASIIVTCSRGLGQKIVGMKNGHSFDPAKVLDWFGSDGQVVSETCWS